MAIYYDDAVDISAWLGSYQAVLAADTDTTVTVPTGATHAIFSTDYPIWVDESAITLPASGSFAVTTALKNPVQCTVTSGATLHIRGRLSGDVHVTFFA